MTLKSQLIKKINEARERLRKDRQAAELQILRYLAVLRWRENGKPDKMTIRGFQGRKVLQIRAEYDKVDGFCYLVVDGFMEKDVVIDVQSVTFEAGD